MDPNIIYVKTAAGENAIMQRSQILQRNVRMVLILVDGHSSVSDLTRKVGNLQLTESALVELEMSGLIEPKPEAPDPLEEETRRVAEEIRTAASGKKKKKGARAAKMAQEAPPEPPAESSPEEIVETPSDSDIGAGASEPRAPEEPEPAVPGMSTASYSMFMPKEDMVIPSDEPHFPPPPEPDSYRPSVYESAPEPSGEWLPPPVKEAPKPSFFSRLFARRARPAREEAPAREAPVKVRSMRYRAPGGTSWLFWIVFGLLGAFAVAFAAALVFPFSLYVPELEAAMSQALGRPVSIGDLNVDIYPAPGIILGGGVRIGQEPDALQAREILVQPDLGSLFSGRLGLRKALVTGAELRLERLAGLAGLFDALANSPKAPAIVQIQFDETAVSFNGIKLEGMEIDARRDAAGRLQALEARLADRSLMLTVRPAGASLDLTLEANGWSPGGAGFVFDFLGFKGRLEGGALTISGLDIRALDGRATGGALVRADGRPNVAGQLVFERIDAGRLTEALGIGKKLAGALNGSLRYTAAAPAWPAILAAVDGEGEFMLSRGSFTGIDLAEAARRPGGAPVRGGTTAFEQLSGRFRLTPEKNQFHDLAAASGLMQTAGRVDLARGGQLSGRFDLQMRGSANHARVPVLVSGTIDAPEARALGRQ